MGLFRVIPQDLKVRKLEKHLAREDFPYLDTVESPHVVASHWKRLFLALPEPLIPQSILVVLDDI